MLATLMAEALEPWCHQEVMEQALLVTEWAQEKVTVLVHSKVLCLGLVLVPEWEQMSAFQ